MRRRYPDRTAEERRARWREADLRARQRAHTAEVLALRHEADAAWDDLIALLGYYPRRPRTRGECGEARPCPWVGCRYHLYGDDRARRHDSVWTPNGVPLEDMPETCALDVADRGTEPTMDEIAALMNVTRQRVDQIEKQALRKLARLGLVLEDFL